MYYAIALIVFFATVAMMVQTGLWNNLVKLIAIVTGGVTAFGVYQPLTIMADEATDGSYTYLLDILILGLSFAVVTGLIELFAQLLSRHRVAFPDAVDRFGGLAVGLLTGYLLCGFVMAALHTAPLSRDAFSGQFVFGDTRKEVEQKLASTSGLTHPDVMWLNLTSMMLSGERWGGSGFSPSVYVHTYAEHRRAFESIQESIVKRK